MLAVEASRQTEDDYRIINFCLEGSFYRAYEWSAWLAVRFISELKVTKRYSNAAETSIVFVGFPLGSMQKFTPKELAPTTSDDGKLLKMVVPLEMFGVDNTLEKLSNDYLVWKNSIEELPKSNQKNKDGGKSSVLQEGKPARLTDIMLKILACPIEQKSPLECMAFIAELKKEITEIL